MSAVPAATARLAELEQQLAARGVVAPGDNVAGRPAVSTGIRQIHVSRLVPNPANVRKNVGDVSELAASMKVHGVLQPLIAEARHDGRYLVIAGHRRLAAARRAGLDTVPVDVRPGAGSATRVTVLMLVENCQREDLTAVEKAEALGRLRDEHRWTVAQISANTGLGQSTVSRYLTLLELDDESRERVKAGAVGVGRALDAVRDARAARRQRPSPHPGGGAVAPRRPAQPVRVEPPWFTRRHPLAETARAMCDHASRPLEGGVACGQCFEEAIRADERARVAAGGADRDH